MSRLICVMGESGSGKTTAMRNLDPKSTYYIDCDGKGLAWKDWRSQYNEANRNFAYTRDIQKIAGLVVNISQKKPETKTIVIDTLNTCMVDKEVKSMTDELKRNGLWQMDRLDTVCVGLDRDSRPAAGQSDHHFCHA